MNLSTEQIANFANYLCREEKSTATQDKYLRDVQAFFTYADDYAITKELVVAWKKSLVEHGYAVRSINSMLASVNSLLDFLGLPNCKVKNIRTQQQTYCTEDGYIEVYTIEDLYSIRNDLAAKYILMNDINLTAATAKGGDWDFMGNGWNPIGSDDIYGSLAFSGEFNGNGKRIIGMRIDGTTMPSGVGVKYVGLFANVTGSVHDLVLENTVITWPQSGTSYVGSVAGMNSGSIYNISADVTITLDRGTGNLVGGIVGRSQGTVSRCSTSGSIKYSYSYSSGSVHTSGVGGIVGYATGGTISECYNTARLEQKNAGSGSYGFVGGICGMAYYYSGWEGSTTVKIENCYNTGNITSNDGYYIAGILGCTDNDGSTTTDGTYKLTSVAPGTYSLVVSKLNHATRTYEITVTGEDIAQDVKIHLLGDITGDGKLNARDVNRANAHAKKTATLTGYELVCADVNADGRVNARDVNRMNAHAKKTALLW